MCNSSDFKKVSNFAKIKPTRKLSNVCYETHFSVFKYWNVHVDVCHVILQVNNIIKVSV